MEFNKKKRVFFNFMENYYQQFEYAANKNLKQCLALQPVTFSIAINALTMTHTLAICYLLLANFQLLVLALYLSPHHHNLRGKNNYACDCDGIMQLQLV